MSTRQFFFFFFFLDVLLPAFLWMLDKALSSSFPPPLPHQKQRPVMNDFEAKPVASTLFGNLLYSSTFSYFLRFGRDARKDVDKCLAIIQQQQLGQCQSVSYLYSFSTLQCFAGVFLERERGECSCVFVYNDTSYKYLSKCLIRRPIFTTFSTGSPIYI